MAWFLLARLLFVGAVGYSAHQLHPLPGGPIVNTLFGVVLGLAIVGFEIRLKHSSVTHMLGALIGGAIGLGAAKTIGAALYWANLDNGRVVFLHSVILLALPYLGLVIGGRKGDWLKPENIISLFRSAGPRKRYKVLDTSVIIDGRIADICETGFMDGTIVIPQFVLKELQLVADSSDSMKRNRGRRGLDILQKVQKMAGVEVTISDMDFPEVREVDLKLIELARTLQGKIVTNDFILKEGKEYNQGVAYLDDGTMVVVDNARKMIGKTIDVVVTSVLQTTAGKMIFGRFIEPNVAAQAQQSVDREGGEPRRGPRNAPQPQMGPAVPAPPITQASTVPPAAPGGAPVTPAPSP